MTCRYIESLLPDPLAGRMTDDEREAVRRHLAGCADCRRTVEEAQALFQRAASGEHENSPSPHYWGSILPRVRERIDKRKEHRVFPAGMLRFLPPVVAAVVVVLLILNVPWQQAGPPVMQEERLTMADLPVEEIQSYLEIHTSEDPVFALEERVTGNDASGDRDALVELLGDDGQEYFSPVDEVLAPQEFDDDDAEQLLAILQEKQH